MDPYVYKHVKWKKMYNGNTICLLNICPTWYWSWATSTSNQATTFSAFLLTIWPTPTMPSPSSTKSLSALSKGLLAAWTPYLSPLSPSRFCLLRSYRWIKKSLKKCEPMKNKFNDTEIAMKTIGNNRFSRYMTWE